MISFKQVLLQVSLICFLELNGCVERTVVTGDPTCSWRILDYPTTGDELQRGVFNWLKQNVVLVGPVQLGTGGGCAVPCVPGEPRWPAAGSGWGHRRPGPGGCRGVLRRLGPSQRAPWCPWRRGLCRGRPPRPAGMAPAEPGDSDGQGESELK